MKSKHLLIWLTMIVLSAAVLHAQEKEKSQATVKYISIESVYIDAGRDDGLAAGDTVQVVRDNQIVAYVVIKNIAKNSASCQVIRSVINIKTGDKINLPHARPVESLTIHTTAEENQQKVSRHVRSMDRANRVRGYISTQNSIQIDDTGRNLTSMQPGFSGILRVENLFNSGIDFRMRQRSRYHKRSSGYDALDRDSAWQNRFFEFSFSQTDHDADWQYGIGRVFSPHIRGIGYIDGAHISRRVSERVRLGVAAGADPDEQTLNVNGSRNKFGAFATVEAGSYENKRLASTMAYAGSYDTGTVNREFLYLQNNFYWAKRLSLYQNVEVDFNRGWRKDAAGTAVSFSNFYLSANMKVWRFISMYFSYDARKNVRTIQTMHTPDSLFDDALRTGLSSGFVFAPGSRMRGGINASMRFPDNGMAGIISGSAYYSIRHFPRRGQSMAVRFSYFNTQFTNAFRPTLNYRIPLLHRLFLNLNTGSYIYQTASFVTTSYYYEVQADYSFWQRYYFSTNYRQYLDSILQSKQIYVELGVNL
ncbi:MAG: hypothetical protein H6696_13120 [Deferribacteres bacterium]|nr:hypothetical protein [candidate division KSB1 bacterium]MCB9502871.1 hypothetical protein [Deferribacteres bacterium]